MGDQRNLLLAIVLSVAVLLGWSFISDRLAPTAAPQTTKIVDGKSVPLPQPQANPTADSPAATRDRRIVLAESPRVAINTPRLRGSLNLRGARVDDLLLVQHTETIARDSAPIRLLSPAGTTDSYYGSFGWIGEGVAVPTADTLWTADGRELAPGRPVTLSWSNPTGQTFRIRLSVDENYMFTAEQSVANRGAAAVVARPYASILRVGVSKDPDGWTMHTGPMAAVNGVAEYVNFSEVDEAGAAGRRFASTGGWFGFTDKYWLAAVIPDPKSSVNAAFLTTAPKTYQALFTDAPASVAPGRIATVTNRMFAGAKEVSVLDGYVDTLGIARLDRAIDWGWFIWFEKPIFALLDWLFRTTGNFGVAIILLTCIVRAVMFPVAQKGFQSMASMRVLQPKMKALQERHKDDKSALQAEMLKLYQSEKVNPLAGCLPILVQIPIFYALYKVLMLTIEMRHQPFALWVKDLSAPDPMTPLNLFGLLDFTPPTIIAIGVLPILVGVTMWLQFKLNPAQPDPIQQQVFSIMPWILMFAMAGFAAGLQLYWFVNNVLSIAQQKWLYSRYPGMKAVDAKPADGKA